VYIQRHRLGGDDIAGQVEQEAQHVGHHGDKQDELGKLPLSPCALEVAAAVEERRAVDDEAGEVLLDDGGQGKDPGIDDRLARHDGEVGHAVADPDQGLLDLLDPVGLGAQREVEQREEERGRQQAAGYGRQGYAGHGWAWMRRARSSLEMFRPFGALGGGCAMADADADRVPRRSTRRATSDKRPGGPSAGRSSCSGSGTNRSLDAGTSTALRELHRRPSRIAPDSSAVLHRAHSTRQSPITTLPAPAADQNAPWPSAATSSTT
jgi:hypothetical protein